MATPLVRLVTGTQKKIVSQTGYGPIMNDLTILRCVFSGVSLANTCQNNGTQSGRVTSGTFDGTYDLPIGDPIDCRGNKDFSGVNFTVWTNTACTVSPTNLTTFNMQLTFGLVLNGSIFIFAERGSGPILTTFFQASISPCDFSSSATIANNITAWGNYTSLDGTTGYIALGKNGTVTITAIC